MALRFKSRVYMCDEVGPTCRFCSYDYRCCKYVQQYCRRGSAGAGAGL